MDRFSFTDKSEIADHDWDCLVNNSPDGWLYQTTSWMNYAQRWGSKPLSFGITSQKGDLVGAFPLYRDDMYVRKIFKIKRLYTGLSGPVLSPLLTQKVRKKIWEGMFSHIDEIAEHERLDLLQVRLTTLAPSYLPPNRPEINPLYSAGLVSPLTLGLSKVVQPLTRVMFLDKTENQLLMEMDTDCRAAVRQAERNELEFVSDDSTNGIEAYHCLHNQSWERTGLTPHPIAYFEDMWESLHPMGALRIFFAKHKGDIVAAIMIHLYKGSVFYWGGCSAGGTLNLRPNNFLLWNAIKWAQNHAYRYFEIGQFYPHPTDNIKEYNVGKFKIQFGRDELIPFEGQKVYRTGKIVTVAILKNLKKLIQGRFN